MYISLTIFALASTLVSAVPYKRYDNETSTVDDLTTTTIDRFFTITETSSLSYVSSLEIGLSYDVGEKGYTSTVTDYATITFGSQTATTPVSTYVTSGQELTTTSTITQYLTVTTGIYSAHSANLICTPSTVTVTVTGSQTELTSTVFNYVTSSVPLVAEITLSEMTTTITSYVPVTLTQTSYIQVPHTSLDDTTLSGNSTTPAKRRRGLLFTF